MFTWLIDQRLAKAAYADFIPEGIKRVIVAAEFHDSQFALIDEATVSDQQKDNLRRIVEYGLLSLLRDEPIVFVCAQGRSRSVTAACITAAIYEKKSFAEEYKKLKLLDADIANPSPLLAAARPLFPHLF